MRGFIDRVADGVAVIVLEGGGRAYLPVSRLPREAQAGGIVEVTVSSLGTMSADEVADLIERLQAGEHHHHE